MSIVSRIRGGQAAPDEVTPEADTQYDDAMSEAALDTLASVLRTYGSNGFDIDCMSAGELGRHCETWTRHVLTGTPPPSPDIERPEHVEPTLAPPSERRWGELRQFFREHRTNEQAAAIGRGEEMRGLITEVAQGLRSAISDDTTKDKIVTQELSALGEAVQSDSLEAVRNQVVKTIEVVSSVVRERQARYEAQLRSMSKRVRSLRADLVELREKVNLDPLTQAHNRGAFDNVLGKQVDFSFLSGQPLGLMMIDLDHFKQINDTHGHPGGDLVLQSVVDVLVRVCPRRSDFIARYGGEEFAVILVDVETEDLLRVSERILDAIRSLRVEYRESVIELTCSVGMASHRPEDSAASLLERADAALYEAKQTGRDRAILGNP